MGNQDELSAEILCQLSSSDISKLQVTEDWLYPTSIIHPCESYRCVATFRSISHKALELHWQEFYRASAKVSLWLLILGSVTASLGFPPCPGLGMHIGPLHLWDVFLRRSWYCACMDNSAEGLTDQSELESTDSYVEVPWSTINLMPVKVWNPISCNSCNTCKILANRMIFPETQAGSWQWHKLQHPQCRAETLHFKQLVAQGAVSAEVPTMASSLQGCLLQALSMLSFLQLRP